MVAASPCRARMRARVPSGAPKEGRLGLPDPNPQETHGPCSHTESCFLVRQSSGASGSPGHGHGHGPRDPRPQPRHMHEPQHVPRPLASRPARRGSASGHSTGPIRTCDRGPVHIGVGAWAGALAALVLRHRQPERSGRGRRCRPVRTYDRASRLFVWKRAGFEKGPREWRVGCGHPSPSACCEGPEARRSSARAPHARKR